MHILAISGSLRASSTSTTLIRAWLMLTPTALSSKIPAGDTLIIPTIRTKMNPAGEVTDPTVVQALRSVLEALAGVIETHN